LRRFLLFADDPTVAVQIDGAVYSPQHFGKKAAFEWAEDLSMKKKSFVEQIMKKSRSFPVEIGRIKVRVLEG